jgi:hypothetical protein
VTPESPSKRTEQPEGEWRNFLMSGKEKMDLRRAV